MAVKKNDSSTPVKKPIAEVRKENDELHAQIEKLENGAYCYICGKHKGKEHFYQSSDPNVKSGIVPVCKKCAYDIACKKDESGKYHDLHTATFCGQQGRISRTVRAILNGQPGISAGQRVVRPTDQYCSLFQQKAMLSQSVQ